MSGRPQTRCSAYSFKIAVHILLCLPDIVRPCSLSDSFLGKHPVTGHKPKTNKNGSSCATPWHPIPRLHRNVCPHPRLCAANIFRSSPERSFHGEFCLHQFCWDLWLPCSRIYEPHIRIHLKTLNWILSIQSHLLKNYKLLKSYKNHPNWKSTNFLQEKMRSSGWKANCESHPDV